MTREARTIHARIAAWAERRPDAPAIIAPGRPPLTYAGLWERIEKTVKTLNEAGVGRGDRVAVVLPDGPELITVLLGISAAAAVAPLNPNYRAEEFEFYLTDLKPKALVISAGSETPAATVARSHEIPILAVGEATEFDRCGFGGRSAANGGFTEASDIALLLHTSGTTSRPKLVPLTHSNLSASGRNVAATLHLRESDICLNVMPLFHIHGIVGAVISSLTAGGAVVCHDGFQTETFFTLLRDYRPTWYTAVPTIHQAILAYIDEGKVSTPDLPLRFIRSSSAALPPKVMERLEKIFHVPVIEAYGMTEAAHQMASNPLPPGLRKPGSVGLAAGPEIAVMDDIGNILGHGRTGEIVIRGDNVTAGYLDNPTANSRSFTQGWFRTGDQGYLDEDGYLFITGRLKEIINRGGEKISPREIDEILLAHPAVAQAVAFAVPHETLGEDIAAAVVLASGRAAGEEEIRQFVAARVADFKVPSQILIVDELPKGPSGKIQRIGLAETLRSRLDGSFAPPRTAVELALATIWADVLGIRRPGIRDNFFALGGDSLSAARVFSRIAQKYGKTLPLATLFEAPTIEKLAAVLENGIPHGPAPCVVAIQPQGSRPPFFCIHNPGGEVLLYRNLARHLGADQPFYGIQAQGIDGKAPVHTTVEEMAGHYIREIQKIQARGPYFLGGFCFGGQIAFEIARRLSERGEKIGLVAMFESFVRRYPPALQAELPPVKLFPWLQQKIAVHVRALLKMRPERRMQYFTRRLRNLKIMVHLWLLRVIGDLCKACGVSLPSVLQLRDLTLIHYQAGRTYVPQPFAGNVVLFLSQETLETSIEDPSAPWRRLTSGKLQVRHLACTHYDILREPAVEDLAQELRDCIDRELALILVTAPQRAKPAVSEHTHS